MHVLFKKNSNDLIVFDVCIVKEQEIGGAWFLVTILFLAGTWKYMANIQSCLNY